MLTEKVFLGHSQSHDVVFTWFGQYKTWLQSLELLPGAWLMHDLLIKEAPINLLHFTADSYKLINKVEH